MAGFQILTVPSSSSPHAEAAGNHAADRLRESDHRVSGPRRLSADRSAVRKALAAAASDPATQVILVVGGSGIHADDVVPEVIGSLTTTSVPGFGEVFRLATYRDTGSAAQLHRSRAAILGPAIAFGLPASTDAIDVALDELILPELDRFLAALDADARVPSGAVAPASDEVEDAEVETVSDEDGDDDEEEEDSLPPPEPRWRLGTTSSSVQLEAQPVEASAPEDDDVPDRGWKRAVYDLEGEILRGKSPDVPQNLEGHAPIMDVLYQAGEYAQLKLPNGNRTMIYGFPDLQRANSKVLLVGWGEPLAEVVALHRYPIQAGTCIEEDRGLMPGRDADVGAIAEAITGRTPPDTSGELFAVDHDTVYIQRGKWVYSWDGRKERQEGNPKQALTSMVVRWHAR